MIAPTHKIREEVEKIVKPKWIWVKRDLPFREGHIYEVNPDYTVIDNNGSLFASHVNLIREINDANI